MPPLLEDTLQLLAGLDSEERDPGLESAIGADLEAQKEGFWLSLLAPDPAELECLAAAFRGLEPGFMRRSLPPFQEVAEWTADDLAVVARSAALLAVTNARQLVPHSLVRVLEEARRLDLPVTVLVNDLDRVRDPRGLAVRAEGEIRRSVPDLTLRFVCLGGERFSGPDLESVAAAEATRLREEWDGLVQWRRRALAGSRAREARAHGQGRRAALTQRQGELEELSLILSQGSLAAEIFARSEATLWSGRLEGMIESVRSLRSDALAWQALPESLANGLSLTERMESAVREAMESRFRTSRRQISLALHSRLQELRTRLARDRDRYSGQVIEVLGVGDTFSPLSGELAERIESSLENTLETIERHALDAVRVSSKLLDLLASEDVRTLFSPRHQELEKTALEAAPEAVHERKVTDDEASALHQETTSRVTQMVQNRLIESHVISEIASMLAKAERQAQERRERAYQEWSNLFLEMARNGFKDLKQRLQRERSTLAERLRGLERVLDELGR